MYLSEGSVREHTLISPYFSPRIIRAESLSTTVHYHIVIISNVNIITEYNQISDVNIDTKWKYTEIESLISNCQN
jgi:hypothetical protein